MVRILLRKNALGLNIFISFNWFYFLLVLSYLILNLLLNLLNILLVLKFSNRRHSLWVPLCPRCPWNSRLSIKSTSCCASSWWAGPHMAYTTKVIGVGGLYLAEHTSRLICLKASRRRLLHLTAWLLTLICTHNLLLLIHPRRHTSMPLINSSGIRSINPSGCPPVSILCLITSHLFTILVVHSWCFWRI